MPVGPPIRKAHQKRMAVCLSAHRPLNKQNQIKSKGCPTKERVGLYEGKRVATARPLA